MVEFKHGAVYKDGNKVGMRKAKELWLNRLKFIAGRNRQTGKTEMCTEENKYLLKHNKKLYS